MLRLFCRAVFILGLSVPFVPHLALAQPQPPNTAPGITRGQLNFSFQEPIPANGDIAAAHAKILSDADSACAAVQKSFGFPCVVTNIEFYGQNMGSRYGNQLPPNMVGGNVNMMLVTANPQ
jgi:hypothetical protein